MNLVALLKTLKSKVRPLAFTAILLSSALITSNATSFLSNSVINKINRKYGIQAKRRAVALNNLLNQLRSSSELVKIKKVNSFFNQIPYVTDMRLFGKKDYWQTRSEFLGRGAGDCEDYVIAKYFSLKQLGISTKKLYFTYVKALKLNQAHMVLTYYKTPKSIPLVLDSINSKILPATSRRDLVPVYSFNGDALFLSKQTGLGKIVPSGNKKNKKWLQLMSRMKREGL